MDEEGEMMEEGSKINCEEKGGGGRELGTGLNLDPDPWKILWIRIPNTI